MRATARHRLSSWVWGGISGVRAAGLPSSVGREMVWGHSQRQRTSHSFGVVSGGAPLSNASARNASKGVASVHTHCGGCAQGRWRKHPPRMLSTLGGLIYSPMAKQGCLSGRKAGACAALPCVVAPPTVRASVWRRGRRSLIGGVPCAGRGGWYLIALWCHGQQQI